MQETLVIIVGAGPSGLATAASLTLKSVPYAILEREDCIAPLWQKHSYDRLHLHLRKQFCELPHMPFPNSFPTYVPKDQFVQYMNDYMSRFKINPLFNNSVESASYSEETKKWCLKVKNLESGVWDEYRCRFLVVASGESCNAFIPDVDGLESFGGEVLHSTQFKNGKAYVDKNVLVVGSGNSGMEIALDLASNGAQTSIVVRSSIHILTREIVDWGLSVSKYLPVGMVDSMMVMVSKLVHGDMSKHGITRPKEGPFYLKNARGKYPIIDVGTCEKIKSGDIQVMPAIQSINGNQVAFENGKGNSFDAIIFCTGFKRSLTKWLKGDDYLFNEDGYTKQAYPNHWKGRNGIYSIGLSKRGLYQTPVDSQKIANDISSQL